MLLKANFYYFPKDCWSHTADKTKVFWYVFEIFFVHLVSSYEETIYNY